jgi:hypothetical protein
MRRFGQLSASAVRRLFPNLFAKAAFQRVLPDLGTGTALQTEEDRSTIGRLHRLELWLRLGRDRRRIRSVGIHHPQIRFCPEASGDIAIRKPSGEKDAWIDRNAAPRYNGLDGLSPLTGIVQNWLVISEYV